MTSLTCVVLFGVCLAFTNATFWRHKEGESSRSGHGWHRLWGNGHGDKDSSKHGWHKSWGNGHGDKDSSKHGWHKSWGNGHGDKDSSKHGWHKSWGNGHGDKDSSKHGWHKPWGNGHGDKDSSKSWGNSHGDQDSSRHGWNRLWGNNNGDKDSSRHGWNRLWWNNHGDKDSSKRGWNRFWGKSDEEGGSSNQDLSTSGESSDGAKLPYSKNDGDGSSGKSGNDEGSSVRKSAGDGSSGRTGKHEGSSGKSGRHEGSSGRSGRHDGSSGKSGSGKGSSARKSDKDGSSRKSGKGEGSSNSKTSKDRTSRSSNSGGHSSGSKSRHGTSSDSSSVQRNTCTVNGISYNVGLFNDPQKPCEICRCFSDGTINCLPKQCERLQCGLDLQIPSSDGCCKTCDSKCQTKVCTRLPCPPQYQLSRNGSCCPECGCQYEGSVVPIGMIDRTKDPCITCKCLPDCTVKCVNKSCERPKCSLDLQQPSSDGCCVKCDPKCDKILCKTYLPCPVSKQVYRNDSCCLECNTGCEYEGNRVPVGMIANPKKPCEICICLSNGTVKCVPKVCRKPRCGLDLQRPSSDGCCVLCDPKCYIRPCKSYLPCPVSKQIYRNGSCCLECDIGCEYNGSRVPIGMIADPKKPCEMCICLPNGTVKCVPKMCRKPRCGLDLQRPSSDGCCVTCDPKCYVKPCTSHLPCPVSKQIYRNGSCCPVCDTGCEYNGSRVPVGMIADPKKPCEMCICLPNGTVKCVPKMCRKPRCGLDLQRPSSDGCCVTCDPKCYIKPCTSHLPCPVSKQVYRNGSCCPECDTGCEYNGSRVPVGMITDPKKPCEMCICLPNGIVKCASKVCRKPRCGLDLQKPSSDGCCVMCDPKCALKPCTHHLPCPLSKQVYRNGSCCPECNTGCEYGGSIVPTGLVADPNKPCEICICLPNGTVKCIPKMCRKPRCGLDLQIPTSDGCCVTCDPKCHGTMCKSYLPCPAPNQVSRNGSCCPECGCQVEGTVIPVGTPVVSNKTCETCKCVEDGTIECEPKPCKTPQCGLDLQEKSKDGCCIVCHSRCHAEYPCKTNLPCPTFNKMSRNGTCCPECMCKYEGAFVPVGEIKDPQNPCNICECLENGSLKCEPKECEKPQCGLDLQQKSKDGCCVTCHPRCHASQPCKTDLPCPTSNQVSRNGSCCPECICKYDGSIVSLGPFENPKNSCEICRCLDDGSVTCEHKKCEKPQCGLDLREMSKDGCCVTCHPKCHAEYPCKPKCPAVNLVSRDGFCCPQCICRFEGSVISVGPFNHPKIPCEMCKCLDDGSVKCEPKSCEKPQCGLDLQEKSKDGCCIICHPKCHHEYPCSTNLPCPLSNQMSRNGSCCPECVCKYEETIVPVGLFDNPKNPCEMCKCLDDGSVKCEPKPCEKPQCGLDLQEMSKDGCCVTCHSKCHPEYPCNTKLPCPLSNQMSRNGSCCPECVCKYEGTIVPLGSFDNPKNPCEMCKCLDDGSVKCEPKPCEKPQCGLDLQEMSKDGCCVTCHPKCHKEYPCNTNLSCPLSDQVSRNGSCCPECVCKYEGSVVPVGILTTDPNKPCQVCECFENGKVKCSPKPCGQPKCGIDFHVKSEDGCCTVCDRRCEGAVLRRVLDCPISNQFYRNSSCLPECGCNYKGHMVSLGPCGHPCDKCECLGDTYQVICDPPKCPKKKLECVDPVYDSKCKLVCPYGQTCLYKDKVIKPGEFLKVGKRFCTCLSDRFYPEPFCAMTKLSKKIKELQKSKCVAKAANLSSKKRSPFTY